MRWLAFVTALLAAAIIGYGAMQPLRVVPASAPATAFSAERAMVDVRAMAQRPHPTGSAENARVRALLMARLQALGFEVRETPAPLGDNAKERLAKWGEAVPETAVNLIAVRPAGDAAVPLVALMAHYDSVTGSPGAADDAAGVAAALEIARATANDPARRGLAIILTDAEELGLDGARGFFAGDPLVGRIGMIVNMETRGGGGRAMMFETIGPNGQMIDMLRRNVHSPKANSLSVRIYQLLPNSTDLTTAKPSGIPGYNYAFLGNAALYHSPLATPENLDPRSVQDMGAQALDLTRALLTAPALPAAAPDAVFSDVLGGFVIAYPVWVGWVVLGVALALIIVAARRTARDWRVRDIVAGLLVGPLAVLVAGGLIYGFNLLSGADGPTNYYDRLAALPRIEFAALLLGFAGLVAVLGTVRHDRAREGGWIGLALLNLIIAVAIQILIPAAGPLFAWPLLLAAVAMLVAAYVPLFGTIAALVVAALGLAMAADFGHFLLLGIGITMPWAAAVLLPIALLLLWPLRPPLGRGGAWVAVLVLVIVAAALGLWVRLDPVAPSVATYSSFD
jgi:hypothetical protein